MLPTTAMEEVVLKIIQVSGTQVTIVCSSSRPRPIYPRKTRRARPDIRDQVTVLAMAHPVVALGVVGLGALAAEKRDRS